MTGMGGLLEQRCTEGAEVRRRMYRALSPWEREQWHAVWLLATGRPACHRRLSGMILIS